MLYCVSLHFNKCHFLDVICPKQIHNVIIISALCLKFFSLNLEFWYLFLFFQMNNIFHYLPSFIKELGTNNTKIIFYKRLLTYFPLYFFPDKHIALLRIHERAFINSWSVYLSSARITLTRNRSCSEGTTHILWTPFKKGIVYLYVYNLICCRSRRNYILNCSLNCTLSHKK